MDITELSRRIPLTCCRWGARIWAAGLLVLWGSFFVEHLSWFAGHGPWPPPEVWFTQACHLALLAGLVAGWKWELLGGGLTIAGAALFFARAAGDNFLPFLLLTAVPGLLWLTCAWMSRTKRSEHDANRGGQAVSIV